MIKKKIIFRVCNSIDIYKFYLEIYNNNNEIIYSSYTDNNGHLIIYVENEGIYNFVIYDSNKNKKVKTAIYISNHTPDMIRFSFNKMVLSSITLTDKNYKNLKIERGKIKLWTKSI